MIINESKIEKAVERLRGHEIRIVDVAFSTRFDRLAIFNRYFKTKMDML